MSFKPTSDKQRGLNTRLAHCGNDPRDYFGFVNPPVVHASTVLFPDAATLRSRDQPYTYGTHGTPTTDALAKALDELEGSAGTVLVPSGLAAVTLPLLAFLSAGDHVLITDSVYHPTRRFADTMLKRLGVEVTYYDPLIGADIGHLFQPNTRVVFTESPGSNTFEVQDIPAICRIAKESDVVVMIDNTWATPLYFRPMEWGVDVVIHAATKYPAGHSDLLLGSISANERCFAKIEEAHSVLGICAAPDDAYQVLRGLRTMGVRLAHHEKSALELAQWLQAQEGVAEVLHPALPSHPTHDLWRRDFTGASGVFSIVLDGASQVQVDAFLDSLEIFGMGYSWGGFESLAVPVFLGDRVIAKGSEKGPVIRLQIGLEDVSDLKADLQQALSALKSA